MKKALIALPLVAALVAAGCGGSSGTSDQQVQAKLIQIVREGGQRPTGATCVRQVGNEYSCSVTTTDPMFAVLGIHYDVIDDGHSFSITGG
jgi:hypothetical protein